MNSIIKEPSYRNFKRVIVGTLFVFIAFLSSGNTTIDSLRQLLAEAPEDTGKISLLNTFALEMSATNYDMASLYALQGIVLSKELDENIWKRSKDGNELREVIKRVHWC